MSKLHKSAQPDKKRLRFHERHPNMPLVIALIALIASIIMPLLRQFLEGML